MNKPIPANDYSAWPDANGRFGDYGGLYVPETLMPVVLALGEAWAAAKDDPQFLERVAWYLERFDPTGQIPGVV